MSSVTSLQQLLNCVFFTKPIGCIQCSLQFLVASVRKIILKFRRPQVKSKKKSHQSIPIGFITFLPNLRNQNEKRFLSVSSSKLCKNCVYVANLCVSSVSKTRAHAHSLEQWFPNFLLLRCL